MQQFSSTPNRKMDPIVQFFGDTRQNKAESKNAGRPVFDDIEMVKITFPADRQRTLVRPAHASAMIYDDSGRRARKVRGKEVSYAELFKEQYQAFKSDQTPTVRGTPIAEAPFLTEGRRRSLRALEVYTIEQLAAVDPKKIGMGGQEMVNQAQAYLDNASGSADVTRMASEIATLKRQLESAQAMAAAAAPVAAEGLEAMPDDKLKEYIAERTGTGKPRGNVSRETLLSMAREVTAAE